MATLETYEIITLDRLTADSVDVLKQTMVDFNGTPMQVGDDWRRAYVNSDIGRQLLQMDVEDKYVQAVFTVWGDTPTVVPEVTEPAVAE